MNRLWADLPQHLRDNPFFHFSAETGYVPAWNRTRVEHILPALNHALKKAGRDIDAIANNPKAANFKNTVLALEEAFAIPGYFLMTAYAMMPPKEREREYDAVMEKAGKRYGHFFNTIFRHNRDLYNRFCGVWPQLIPKGAQGHLSDKSSFDFEIAINEKMEWGELAIPDKLAHKHHLYMMYQNGFTEAGIDFTAAKKARLDTLDAQITKLGSKAQRNMKRASHAFKLVLSDRTQLAGLPEHVVAAGARRAKKTGLPGQWVFGLERETYFAFLQTAQDRELRRRMWEGQQGQATRGRYDNRETVLEYGRLIQKKSRLMGYRHLAHDTLQYNMLNDVGQVERMLKRTSAAVLPVAQAELDELRNLANRTDGLKNLEPWDVKFYAERLKKEQFGIGEEELSQYFELEHVLKETFGHFKKQFGLRFVESRDVATYHPDVRAYKVYDRNGRKPIATIFLDLLDRDNKPAGTAWDLNLWAQGHYDGRNRRPVDVVVCKFVPGEPTLLSHDGVATLFHELGHLMNNLLSQCSYTSFSGYYVQHDFVEFYSQFQENFCWEPEVLATLARHHETGAPLPPEVLARFPERRRFMAATDLLDLRLKKAVLDHRWHRADLEKVEDIEAFERRATKHHRLLPSDAITELPHMSYISGGGYEANFHSYLCSLYVEADAFARFKEEGLYAPSVCRDFRRIAARGGSAGGYELFDGFRGREPDEKYLFARYGLTAPFHQAAASKMLTPEKSRQLWHDYGTHQAKFPDTRENTIASLLGKGISGAPFASPVAEFATAAVPAAQPAVQLPLFAAHASDPQLAP